MTETETVTGFAPFSREEMDLASKDQLIRWAKEYGLDEGGMKYELRLRILEYIRRQGLLLKGEEPLDEDSVALSDNEAAAAPPAAPPQSTSGGEAAQTTVQLPSQPASNDSPGACANCGGELSYIAEYERWYCYNCDTYASASAAGASTVAGVSHASSHREGRGRAGAGIALALAGILTFLAYQILFVAPPGLFPIPFVITVAPEVLFALPLLAFVLLGVGVIAGLRSLRHRE